MHRFVVALVVAAVGVTASMLWPHAQLGGFVRILMALGGSAVAAWPVHRMTAWASSALKSLPPAIRRLVVFASTVGGPLFVIGWPLRAPGIGALLYGAWAIDAAFVLALVALFLGRSSAPIETVDPKPTPILTSAVAFAILGGLYWTSFYPAVMTSDSIDQWGQLLTLQVNNHHPAFHTMMNWLITRLWLSPAAISLFQILAFSLCLGFVIDEFAYWGVPLAVRIMLTILLAASPINGAMLMTIWKDIPFSIAMLLLSGMLLHSARTDFRSWRDARFLLGIAVTLASILLLRHNGISVVLAMLVMTPLAPTKARARFVGTLLCVIATVVLVTGPLYSKLGVQPMDAVLTNAVQIETMGAILQEEPPLTEEQRAVLSEILPIERWRQNYSCFTVDSLYYFSDLNSAFFDSAQNVKRFRSTWLQLARSHVPAILKHQACISSMLWLIRDRTEGYFSTYSTTIDDNPFGLRPASLWPRGRELLVATLNWSTAANSVLWRPALFLYVGLFATVCGIIRSQRIALLWWLFPMLAHFASLAVVIPTQDFRYAYSTYLVGSLSLGLMCCKRVDETVIPLCQRE